MNIRTLLMITAFFFAGNLLYGQNIGIGTSTPSSRLEVIGTGNTITSSAFHVQNSTGFSLFMIKNNGYVGVNNSNPGSALDIKGGLRLTEYGSGTGFVGFYAAAGSGSTYYTLPPTDGTTGQVLSTNGGGYLSWITPQGGSTGTSISCSGSNTNYTVRGDGSGTWECTNDLQVNSSGYVSINTSPSSSYRLKINGNLGIGYSPPSSSYDLAVDGDSYLDGGVRIGDGLGVGTSDPYSGLYVGSSSNFYVPSSMSSGTYNQLYINSGRVYKASSSIRFKEHVEELTFDKKAFLNIRTVRFNYKKEFGDPDNPEVGVIAEEVEKLVPELVVYESKMLLDGNNEPIIDESGSPVYVKTNVPDGVRYDRMPVYLISIVAEQEETIQSMNVEIESLKEKLEKLEALILEMNAE